MYGLDLVARVAASLSAVFVYLFPVQRNNDNVRRHFSPRVPGGAVYFRTITPIRPIYLYTVGRNAPVFIFARCTRTYVFHARASISAVLLLLLLLFPLRANVIKL